jgi:hypothetical protein
MILRSMPYYYKYYFVILDDFPVTARVLTVSMPPKFQNESAPPFYTPYRLRYSIIICTEYVFCTLFSANMLSVQFCMNYSSANRTLAVVMIMLREYNKTKRAHSNYGMSTKALVTLRTTLSAYPSPQFERFRFFTGALSW